MIRLYVGGLPYSTTEEELRELFEQSGTVSSVAIIRDRDSGSSRGFGFVEMGSDEQAKAAMSHHNGKLLGGRTLIVNEAKERADSSGPLRDSNRGYNSDRRW